METPFSMMLCPPTKAFGPISMGADAYNYNVDLVSLTFSYKFGGTGPELKKE